MGGGWIRAVRLEQGGIEDPTVHPFDLPAVRALDELTLDPGVTLLVGENGSGKSTLVEAIAVAAGFNAEGGSRNFAFSTRDSTSGLHRHLRLVRAPARPATGFFLRAESFFNVATQVEELGRGRRVRGAGACTSSRTASRSSASCCTGSGPTGST